MKVLVIGSGGREHALTWALSLPSSPPELFALPGNPGIARLGTCLPGDPTEPAAVTDVARQIRPDLIVIGPEAPLVAGVGDALRVAGFQVFGPDAAAARIEGSKAFAKDLMDTAGIPTARWRAFDVVDGAIAYLDTLEPPFVVKADGLAAGKGVVVTRDREEAIEAIRQRVADDRFTGSGPRVVIEEFLDGEEVSIIAFSDGRVVVPCEPAQDYKRAFDGDEGPNTGGMGSYSPVPFCPPVLTEQVVADILQPMVDATAAVGAPFLGALYAGLALTATGPRVVEFNARFGDPETQALVPRLDGDLARLMLACATGDLARTTLQWSPRACVSVVLASEGYPDAYETGFEIEGLDEASRRPGVAVFHAGTARRDGSIVTAGGRVLSVSALGDTLEAARDRAYEAAAAITFQGKHLRTDIARDAARPSPSRVGA